MASTEDIGDELFPSGLQPLYQFSKESLLVIPEILKNLNTSNM